MRRIELAAAAALVLAAAACNDGSGSGGNVTTDADVTEDAAVDDALGTGPAAPASTPLPVDAAGFANAVAASDLYEIESSKLAREKATSAELRSFAQMLQREHENSTAKLKSVAAAANAAPGPALDAEKQGMLDDLKGLSGSAFDRRYMAQQRTAHQKALMLLQNYQASGDSDALKTFAATAQKTVEEHLDRLNNMPI